MGRHDHCIGLCNGQPPWCIPTKFVWHMTMYIICFLYRGILNLATKCQLNSDYISFVGVEYYSGHQESSQPFIVDCILQSL